MTVNQGRIFIFGALRYFKLGAPPEGLQRLMSYKSALHVLATFTEQVFQFINILQYFILNSLGIRNQSHVSRPPYPNCLAILSHGTQN